MTIQTHVDAITSAILNAEAFAEGMDVGPTRDAALLTLGLLHTAAAEQYKEFKRLTSEDEEAQAARSPADDKD